MALEAKTPPANEGEIRDAGLIPGAGRPTGEGNGSPPPGDLLCLGIEPASLTPPALAGGFFTTSATWEALLVL